MFETVCRISRSCYLNAKWWWDGGEGRMEVRAVRDIDGGEEITFSCVGDREYDTVTTRRQRLSKPEAYPAGAGDILTTWERDNYRRLCGCAILKVI